MRNLKERFKKLEQDVFVELVKRITKSKYISKHINDKAIEVNIFHYVELALINDRLTFMDKHGYQYSVYTECSLEDLVDLL